MSNLAVEDFTVNEKQAKPLLKWAGGKSQLLPTKDNWWSFYNNIMERLSSRNEQIEKLNVE